MTAARPYRRWTPAEDHIALRQDLRLRQKLEHLDRSYAALTKRRTRLARRPPHIVAPPLAHRKVSLASDTSSRA